MVQNSGKTVCAGAGKPVNVPQPVSVEENPNGLPVAIKIVGRQLITAIEDRWRIDDEWWRSESISRMYYAVLFKSGQRLVIFKDLNSGLWYKQEY